MWLEKADVNVAAVRLVLLMTEKCVYTDSRSKCKKNFKIFLSIIENEKDLKKMLSRNQLVQVRSGIFRSTCH